MAEQIQQVLTTILHPNTIATDITVTVAKIGENGTAVPDDVNILESQANQDMVTITQLENNISIDVADGETLNDYDLMESGSEGKWIGLSIDTGLDDITKVKYNGQYMTEEDVEKADAVGLLAGNFVLWVNYDELVDSTITFTLQADGFAAKTFTVEAI